MLETDLFTFTVGHDGEEVKDFKVHSGVVAEHSAQLATLMTSDFGSEAKERRARLEDVDVPTFRRFLDFVYFRAYEDPEAEYYEDDKRQNPAAVCLSLSGYLSRQRLLIVTPETVWR